MASHCNILNFPMEVLDLVFKSIPEMEDKLNLAKAHEVLGKAFAFHAGDSFKNIEIEKRPMREWTFILSLCGSSVTRIINRSVDTTASCVAAAAKYCPNLEEFFIPVRSHIWNNIKTQLLALKNINRIGLTNAYEKVNVVDTLLKMPKLEILQLAGFNSTDLETLGKLVNLTSLTIMNKREEPIDVFKMCSPMKSLDSLEVRYAFIREPNKIVEGQLWPKIDSLRVNSAIFYTSLPYLPTLKFLTIDCIDPRTKLNNIFGLSVFGYGQTLESLRFGPAIYIFLGELGIMCKLKALKRLDCQVSGVEELRYICQLENLEKLILHKSVITNRGALMVIRRCRKLRQLNLYGCGPVNKDMVIEAVPVLLLFGVKPDNPLVLLVGPDFGYVDKSKLNGVLDIKYDWANMFLNEWLN